MLPRVVGLIPLSRAVLPNRWSQKLGDWTGIHTGMADWLSVDDADSPPARNPAGPGNETVDTFDHIDTTETAAVAGS